jgi:hypothetical protein
LWQWKGLWLVETLLLGAVLGAAYGWLALPVAQWWHIALHVVVGSLILGLVYLAIRLVRRKVAGGRSAVKEPAFWVAVLLWLVVGLWLPYRLIWWVPSVDGMTAQAFSAGLRFVLAAGVFTKGWMWLVACGAPPAGE